MAAIIAAFILFPSYNDHLVHDIGAFQIGIGVTALLALMRIEASTVFLGGFLLGTSRTPPTMWRIGTWAVIPKM